MKHVQLMTRPECTLCLEPKSIIEQAAAQGLCTWEAVNIDEDRALKRLYGWDIPVVLIDGHVCFQHHMSQSEFIKKLEGA